MSSINHLPGTPVIVTGGASGIGEACAQALAEVGRPVAIWDVDGDRAASVAAAIAKQHSVKVIGLCVDVANLPQIGTAVGESREALGAIGGLVHCAGISGVAPLEELSETAWASVLDINLRAHVFILKAILADLKATPHSAVVGIASINATLGNAMNPAYSASKGGMLSITHALADDLANYGIRINCVSPGQIETPMLMQGIEALPGQKEAFERRIMLGRMGQSREVAAAVRFLMSTEASYITGTELVVDGGNVPSQRA